jgi:hypothetical protein
VTCQGLSEKIFQPAENPANGAGFSEYIEEMNEILLWYDTIIYCGYGKLLMKL